jgi:hypothetical protein
MMAMTREMLPHQSSVSAAIWRWAEPAKKGRPVVTPLQRKRRAVVQACVAGMAGSLLLFVFHHRVAGTIVLCIGAIVLVTGLFIPPLFEALERMGQKLAAGVGIGLTYALMVPFFYLCFLPGHLLLNLLKKDPLRLRFEKAKETYWSPRAPVGVDRFRKQF